MLDILSRSGYEDRVIFVDDVREPGTKISDVEVVGGYRQLEQFDPETDRCIVALGRGEPRLELANRVEKYGYDFFSAIDSKTTVSSTSVIGEGTMINSRSYIGPDAEIESHVLVDSCVNISHDTHIKEGATITPNVTLAGEVTIGKKAYIGAGAVVVDGVSVGDGAVVGAGAVVTNPVPKDTTVVGVPADEI